MDMQDRILKTISVNFSARHNGYLNHDHVFVSVLPVLLDGFPDLDPADVSLCV